MASTEDINDIIQDQISNAIKLFEEEFGSALNEELKNIESFQYESIESDKDEVHISDDDSTDSSLSDRERNPFLNKEELEKIDDNTKFTVFGYIRIMQNEIEDIVIPQGINIIILAFYFERDIKELNDMIQNQIARAIALFQEEFGDELGDIEPFEYESLGSDKDEADIPKEAQLENGNK